MAYESLFNKDLPNELDTFLSLIDNAYKHFKSEGYIVKETKITHWREYGFYIHNKDKSIDLFIGLWYDMWMEKGKVLCICADWKEEQVDGNKIIKIIKNHCEEHKEIFDPYFAYQEHPTLSFKEKYIVNMTDHKNIINRVYNLLVEIGTIWKEDKN